jgi:guanine nucleotide-binding protein G(I)/G(S)/G(T) subunit beta-1
MSSNTNSRVPGSARVEAMRAKVSDLKKQLRALKTAKANGTMKDAREKLGKKANDKYVMKLSLKRTLLGHFGKVMCLASQQSADRLLSASQDGKMILWNGYSGIKIDSISLPSMWVIACNIEPAHGGLVACGGLDNTCTVYSVGGVPGKRDPVARFQMHAGYLSSCAFMTDHSMLTTSGDRTCCLWELENPKSATRFSGHSADVMCSSVLMENPNIFLTGSCDTTAKLWDVRTKASTHTFFGNESDINAIKFFPDGFSFGTASDDGNSKLFDIRCYGEVNSFANSKISSGATSGMLSFITA